MRPKIASVRHATSDQPDTAPDKSSEVWLSFATVHQLTAAELLAVQLLVTDNLSDKQIAAALGRSRADAVKHLQNVRAKLRVHNRGAIINAFRQFEIQWLQGNAPNTPP